MHDEGKLSVDVAEESILQKLFDGQAQMQAEIKDFGAKLESVKKELKDDISKINSKLEGFDAKLDSWRWVSLMFGGAVLGSLGSLGYLAYLINIKLDAPSVRLEHLAIGIRSQN